MSHELPPRRNLESLKKEAKRWLAALHAGDPEARARLARAFPDAAAPPTLRDVQHALAREHGFAGWTAAEGCRRETVGGDRGCRREGARALRREGGGAARGVPHRHARSDGASLQPHVASARVARHAHVRAARSRQAAGAPG